MAKLHILSDTSVAQTIDLKDDLISVGRTEQNEICIPDRSVSKRHAMLVRDGNEYQLHDFNSTNGTFVDGERIMAVKLHDGASIRLGFVELRYESGTAKAATAAVPALAPEVRAVLGVKEPDSEHATKPLGADRPQPVVTPPAPKPTVVAAPPPPGIVRAPDEAGTRPARSGAQVLTKGEAGGLLQSKPMTIQPGVANKPALRIPPPSPPVAPERAAEKRVETRPSAPVAGEIRLRPAAAAPESGEKRIALKPAQAPQDRLHAGPVKKQE